MNRIRLIFTLATIGIPFLFGWNTAAAIIAGLHALQMLAKRSWNLETGLPPLEFEWHSSRIWSRYGHRSYEKTMQAFLTEVNAVDPGTIPEDKLISRAIPRKICYEYKRKYGNLMYHYMTFFTLSLREVLRPLTVEEREQFFQFCREHDV